MTSATNSVAQIPKAELHVHLEGTILPALAKTIAARNGLIFPSGLLSGDGSRYAWVESGEVAGELIAFLDTYTKVANLLRTEEDYRDITYDYLCRNAAENCLYTELTISPAHGRMIGIAYPRMLAGIVRGIDDARRDAGIEARLIVCPTRNFGMEEAIKDAEAAVEHPHPYVTGFGLAGDENALTYADFVPAFSLACKKGGLLPTAHAGEAAGAENVRAAWAALSPFGLRRFGHMVRGMEDEALMTEMAKKGAVAEVCITSNIVLAAYPDYRSHPLRRMMALGLRVTLNSDDPAFFHTSIGREYALAQARFSLSEPELRQCTRHALEAAFVDDRTRKLLLSRLDAGGIAGKKARPAL